MKKSITIALALIGTCTLMPLNAQMAFHQAYQLEDQPGLSNIDVQQDFGLTQFDMASTEKYLPFSNAPFTIEEEEDISNYLPFAEPLFGIESQEMALPLNDNNGYFVESTTETKESQMVIFSDRQFNEIIVSLETSEEKNISIAIHNAYGKEIIQRSILTNQGFNDISVEVEQLESGLYTMKIKSDKESVHKKFIIK